MNCLDCMKQNILSVLNDPEGTIMWSLVDSIEGFDGNWDFFSLEEPESFFWRGLSPTAIKALRQLQKDELVVFAEVEHSEYRDRLPKFSRQSKKKLTCQYSDFDWLPVRIYAKEHWPSSSFSLFGGPFELK